MAKRVRRPLTDTDKKAIFNCYSSAVPLKEAAEITGLPYGTVSQVYRRYDRDATQAVAMLKRKKVGDEQIGILLSDGTSFEETASALEVPESVVEQRWAEIGEIAKADLRATLPKDYDVFLDATRKLDSGFTRRIATTKLHRVSVRYINGDADVNMLADEMGLKVITVWWLIWKIMRLRSEYREKMDENR